jgi:hypothetical protein
MMRSVLRVAVGEAANILFLRGKKNISTNNSLENKLGHINPTIVHLCQNQITHANHLIIK